MLTNILQMKEHHLHPEMGPYIIARVFRVGTKRAGVKFFPDPWALILEGQLSLGDERDGTHALSIQC